MPIVASIGGNTGNQTMALVIRALALDTVQASGARRMMSKELLVSLLNGRCGAWSSACSQWRCIRVSRWGW